MNVLGNVLMLFFSKSCFSATLITVYSKYNFIFRKCEKCAWITGLTLLVCYAFRKIFHLYWCQSNGGSSCAVKSIEETGTVYFKNWHLLVWRKPWLYNLQGKDIHYITVFIPLRSMSCQTIIMKHSSSSPDTSKLSLKTVRKTRYEGESRIGQHLQEMCLYSVEKHRDHNPLFVWI